MKVCSRTVLIVFICIAASASPAFTQDVAPIKLAILKPFEKVLPDTNFVRIYRNKLLVALLGTRKFQRIHIYSDEKNDELLYLPNNPFNFGLSFNYNWISLDLTYKVPFLSKNYAIKGKTDLLRVRIGYNKPKIWITTFMQYCKGWYLKNTDALDENWFENNTEYPLRPDITNFSWFLSMYYSFNNRKITYQSSLGMEQRQMKSAGTFLLGGSVFANYFTADSSLVFDELAESYPDEMKLTEQMNINYGISCGYVHTFVMTKYLFLTLALYPGIHYQSGFHKTMGENRKNIGGDIGSVTESRAVLGYNDDKIYGGVSFTQISIIGFPTNSVITNGYAHLKFFIGKRFNLKLGKKKHLKTAANPQSMTP